MSTILIIGQAEDPHVSVVSSILSDSAHVKILDRYSSTQISTTSKNEVSYDLCWRRIKPQMGHPHKFIFETHERKTFFENNWRDFLEGYGLIKSRKSFHDPMLLTRCENKILQIATAREVGFSTPETLFSSDPGKIIQFAEAAGTVIAKPVRTPRLARSRMLYANIVSVETLREEINALNKVPFIYQHYIEKEYELRSFVFGPHCVTVKLNSQAIDGAQTDWRARQHVDELYQPYELPAKEVNLARRYLDDMSLHFGVFDFIRTKAGELVFLECNVDGQWLPMERAQGTKVAEPFSQWLIEEAGA